MHIQSVRSFGGFPLRSRIRLFPAPPNRRDPLRPERANCNGCPEPPNAF